MRKFSIGEKITAKNLKPLEGNKVAPPLEQDKEYIVVGYVFDSKGNQHIDVGLVSKYEYVRSFETKEELPDGDKIHWCHPSRFE